MQRFTFLLALLCLGGCQSLPSGAASPAYKQVTLAIDDAHVEDCTLLTDVAVEPPLPLLTQSYPELTVMAREDLKNELRRVTAQEGGDTVLMTGIEAGKIHGKTYECLPKEQG